MKTIFTPQILWKGLEDPGGSQSTLKTTTVSRGVKTPLPQYVGGDGGV